MTAKTILALKFGRVAAIRTVASSSSAIWTRKINPTRHEPRMA